MSRRELLRSLAAASVWALGAPGCGPRPATTTSAGSAGRGTGKVALWSWFDLPDDPRSRELSGIAWDEAGRTLWAVQDETANIVPILPNRELTKWGFGPTITLRMDFPLDLEGIVVTPDGFIVASEKGPRILDVDRQGKLRKDLPLPTHFAKARDNKSLEALTMSPDGRWLFTTTEEALSCDGAEASRDAGTRVRILRMPHAGSGEATEHVYTTDASPHDGGDYGVADLCALSDDEVLVLERGWARGYGNTIRVYHANIGDPTTSCLANPSLEGTVAMPKELVVDVGKLPANGVPIAKQPQLSALLDNFEGLSLGPRLPDGRQALFLVSDDNGRTDQTARIVVLALG